MLKKDYPLHDMNIVFDMFTKTLSNNGCDEKAPDEMLFLNKLFGNLPAEAVEYGMRFLHGNTDLPAKCQELIPLYMRFVNFADYCEKLELISSVPTSLTDDDIKERNKAIEDLDRYEKSFLMPIMGYQYNASEITEATENNSPEKDEESQALHLMNASALVFVAEDPLKTSLFYEQKLGFKATHLFDEELPHIRLTRDNIVIILTSGKKIPPMRELAGVKYDMFIYATEPYMLYNELKTNGVKIIEELQSAEEAVNSNTNRQFVFEDNDGRYICVSLSNEIV